MKTDIKVDDDALQHLKTIKVTAWWEETHGRDSWEAVIKEAKARKGLSEASVTAE
jgi:hypothetical protein